MSTRTYNLRARTGTGIATQPGEPSVEIPPAPAPIPLDRELATRVTGVNPAADTTTVLRTYSDVVASRPPSPRREIPVSRSESPVRVIDETGALHRSANERIISNKDNENCFEKDISSDVSGSPQSEDDLPWTTVKRRRARSLSSLNRVRNNSPETISRNRKLTSEQRQTVRAAAEALDKKQKHLIQRRQQIVQTRRKNSPRPQDEGTSKSKGKTIDPREWGNVNMSQESLDLGTQAAVLESFGQHNETIEHKRKQSSRRKRSPIASTRKDRPIRGPNNDGYQSESIYESRQTAHPTRVLTDRSARHVFPAESRPAAQIDPKSYLGTALQYIRRSRSRKQREPASSPSNSSDNASSDEEGPSDEGSESSDQSSQSTHHRRRRDRRHGRSKRPRRSLSNSAIKPIPPKEYNGMADTRAYHRFVRESEAYLRDGKVRGRRKVFLLSYYLTGKAYDFYTQKVSMDEANWTLTRFYTETKRVAEYTYELQELFNMIGAVSEQDRVIKFWNGSRPIIQKGLWRDNLNPEISTWDEVIAQAEIIEISENVAERRDRRNGSSLQNTGSGKDHYHGGSSGSMSKHQQTNKSVRSVTFDAARQSNSQSRGKSQSREPRISFDISNHHRTSTAPNRADIRNTN
ncbi:hypothetical protein BYT27DRAFT_7263507 [Phlegmacium glaucopus]|nr:hypothetical protein BYT27DRAFT_7263507 [Phlegmacium glaucopus]